MTRRDNRRSGEELQVKFSGDVCYLIGNDGRPVGTRTPDLYRVKNVVKSLSSLPALLFRFSLFQRRPRNVLVLVTNW